MLKYLFGIFLVMFGAAAAVSQSLSLGLTGTAMWAAFLAGGIGGGLCVCWLVVSVWRRLAAVNEEKTIVRLINSLFAGLSFTVIGTVVLFSVGLIFPAGIGVKIAQGTILITALLLGLCVGYRLKTSLVSSFLGRRTKLVDRLNMDDKLSNKVLDTSVIIDGRSGPLAETGFLEGEIRVPEFVLSELQNIADSSDSLRRRKGRRGLEVLNSLMHNEHVNVRICSQDYPFIKQVDRKLVHMIREQGGSLLTTDYNLNRVARVEGIRVLNVNELANAVKPQFIPGEEIVMEVIDRGEEIGQGIGYLDDGTMIVVENGRRHIGRKIRTTVKSTLQTEAGRMLFVEPAGENPRWEK